MPQLIEHIDETARRLGRDLLHFCLDPNQADRLDVGDWIRSSAASEIVAWLKTSGIKWGICGPIAHSGWYEGGPRLIYVETPFDPANSDYQRLSTFIRDDAQGRTRWPDTRFCVYPLEAALTVLPAQPDTP